MTYAKILDGAILEVGPRPEWIVDGAPVSDEVLRAGGFECDESGEPLRNPDGSYVLATGLPGWVPVVQQEVVGADELLNDVIWNDQSEWVVEADRVIQTYTIVPRSLLHVKGKAISDIDAVADSYRYVFVTQGGPGQALEYTETQREILAWQTDPAPVIDNYPMLRAEYRARQIAEPDITVQEVIDDSLAEVQLWLMGGAAIKEIRRTGKVAVEVAETPQRVRQIYDWVISALKDATTIGTFDPLSGIEA